MTPIHQIALLPALRIGVRPGILRDVATRLAPDRISRFGGANRFLSDEEPLDELLEEALNVPEAELAALLDERCQGRPELRRRLERLIRFSRGTPPDDFLDPDDLSVGS